MRKPRLALSILMALALCLPLPAARADCPGSYVVQRGEYLSQIARRFNTTAAALASLNRLADPNRIYPGQVLALPAGADCSAQPAPGAGAPAVHIVQRGETLSRIAARYGVTLSSLVAANAISNPSRIFAGQRLVIPGAPAPASPTLPGLILSPGSPEQGRTFWLRLPAEGRTSASGTLGPWPILFFREGESFVGLAGIYALAEAGTYPLTLNLAEADGRTTTHTQSVFVAEGGYARENLNLSPDKSQLLDPSLTIPERERIAAAVAPVSHVRYWTGLFQLPAAGRITSAFGTRRSYNGGPYSSYHGGVDFSFSGGSAIYAPAAGVVVLAEPLVVRGNATIIDHGWGVYSGFWHQSEILVAPGDRVAAGQLVGQIGSTGLVTGPHLHWELFVGGVQVDPMQWTRQSGP